MSGISNEEIIQKALITTQELATAGKLNPVQSDEFIDYVVDVTMLKNLVRVVRFRQETAQIDKIGVSRRVTVPKAQAKDPRVRRGVTTSKIELSPKEQMTPWEISDDFPEHCIEGEDVSDTVMRLMATQTGNDLEELCINGNTLGPAILESDYVEGGSESQVVKDLFWAQFDGWLKLADSGHAYDAEGADISSLIFSRMILEMPVKFRRIRKNLRFLASPDHVQLYREKIASRQTAQGDAAGQSQGSLTPFGVPLDEVPLLDAEPKVVQHVAFGAAPVTVSLAYAPIGTTLYITPTTLASSPQTALVEDTDYTVDRDAGTITSVDGQAMDLAGTWKVTYNTRGQILLTDYQNLIMAIGREIRIERDRDIYAGTNQFAITTKLDVNVEETDAIVKGINIGIS